MSTGAFYSCCTEEEQCRLKLHQTCAHLPRTRLHPLHRHQITLLSAAPSFDRVLSVICAEARAKASLTIVTNATYTLTSNAFLFQTLLSMTLFFNFHPNKEDCKGCGISLTDVRFGCIKCNFHCCVACVKLPLTARYRNLNLTLNLTYHPVPNKLGEYYCEICEGERDPTHWFYSSTDCNFDCHPHCHSFR
ncbi:hypothetical protein ACFX13_008996 [Malus domestica]